MNWREFRQAGRNHTLVWRIAVDHATVHIEHGVLDGAMQSTSDTKKGVNLGKRNEKTPEEVAQENAERQVLMKTRSGYVEHREGIALGQAAKMSFDELPINFRLWKPSNTLSKTLEAKLEAGKAWAVRKRNGQMHPLLIDSWGNPHIYSRTMLPTHKGEDTPYDVRYKHLLDDLPEIPPRSVISVELIMDRDGQDDFTQVQAVTKSLTERALRLQEEQGPLSAYVFDIAFWGGVPVCETLPMEERYSRIHKLFHDRTFFLPADVFFPHEIEQFKKAWSEKTAVEALRAEAIAQGWEGWVIIDPTSPMGDKAWNLRGKTDRPSTVAGKLKPQHEDDFIAQWNPNEGIGTWGTGQFQNSVGAVALYQYNSAGKLIYICNCGGGIKEEGKDKNARPDSPWRHILEDIPNYPLVVEVRYDDRSYKSKGDKTNALSFPRMLCIRTDKEPGECINEEL